MIEIATARPDAAGFGDFAEVAPGVFRSESTGELIASDGEQALSIRISQKK